MARSARPSLALLAWLGLIVAIVDLAARSVVRRGLFGSVGTDDIGATTIVAAIAALAAIVLARSRGRRTLAVLALAFAVGVSLQLRLGARLQSDGFYYYAYLRSLSFDRDVNFLNDYRLLGLTDKPHLFEPTATGHAHSAWTIGPAIVWAPFFGGGHLIASRLAASNPGIATDGTSFPYRQAVCLAGLFYGLLGIYFSLRLARLFAPEGLAAAAAVLTFGGSFMLWYLVREPSMTHAPSMAAVAAFTWLWAATLERRTTTQWVALGALAGLMTLIRWQNAIFGILPICELFVLAARLIPTRDRGRLRRLIVGAAAGGVATAIAVLPQLLAWKAIYGAYFAVSPVGPQLRWSDPHLVDILWSSRNGLFALSPILYVAVLGLPFLIRRRPVAGVPLALSLLAMIFFNSVIQDWWGSAGFGGRRFDGVVPLLTVSLAVALDVFRRLLAARPAWAAAMVVTTALVWNATFAAAARSNVFASTRHNDFGTVAAAQASTLHAAIGHPFSMPINLWFALRNRVPAAAYDLLAASRFLGDPARPYGRIDLGNGDDAFLIEGFSEPAADGPIAYRWAQKRASLRVALDWTAPLRVQIRVRGCQPAPAPPEQMTVRINDEPFGPMAVPLVSDAASGGWQTIEFPTDARVWRTTVNRVVLEFDREAACAPAAHPGAAMAVDYFRVSVLER